MKIYTVDSFTAKTFHGNPAAVCITEKDLPDDLMQSIAMELNLSETAFAVRKDNGFSLRWFTPESEVDLCGHATLATAHILFEEEYLSSGEAAVFHTLYKGVLMARKNNDMITMDFPSAPPVKTGYEDLVTDLFDESKPVYVGIAGNHFLAELAGPADVKNYMPDFEKISSLPKYGLIITSASDGDHDFISRFFAPAVGVNEDPVTGSAHCALAPYWAAKLGKNKLLAYQASRRGGTLELELNGDRVFISGKAVTVLRAEMDIK
ncbi:MAG: PhzF family phenazine biosynthesis protein [Ignavibacteria bacterium]|nr:PhzF family phenazine biosynthesis protein [Ignavibacteria bacterium]